ncbi:MAG: septum formation initiator family protein [Bacteroidota bacterium]|nr:septum formation initiator family protein [Bacteroidota bacterium]
MRKISHEFRYTARVIEYIWNNKISVAVIIFLVYICFFDKYNVGTQFKLFNTMTKLENEKAQFKSLIVEAKKDKKDLEENFEKFAREKYWMSKENEDVFVIENR